MQGSFDSDKLFELNQTVDKLLFLSSDVFNTYFEYSPTISSDREEILYSFPCAKKKFDILFDYIIKMKNQISEL